MRSETSLAEWIREKVSPRRRVKAAIESGERDKSHSLDSKRGFHLKVSQSSEGKRRARQVSAHAFHIVFGDGIHGTCTDRVAPDEDELVHLG